MVAPVSALILIEQFTTQLDAVDQRTREVVAALPEQGLASLDELLLRFNYRHERLTQNSAALALRVLKLLEEPAPVGFAKLLAILDYLDINRNFTVDNGELGMAIEILETFSKVDDAHETLSNVELDMLLAVLHHIDSDGDGRLARSEISSLRDQLWSPGPFLEQQKQTNPQLRQLLGLSSDP
jgi:hypothetical protein